MMKTMVETREREKKDTDQDITLVESLQGPEMGPRECGVDDIDGLELQTLVSCIRTVVWSQLSTSVSSVYVVGSFARGEAREVVSDLDLRIVIHSPMEEAETQACEQLLKNEYGSKVCPSACGYLDPHLTILEPGVGTPHVKVF